MTFSFTRRVFSLFGTADFDYRTPFYAMRIAKIAARKPE